MKNLFLQIAYIIFFIILAIALFKFLLVALVVGLILLWLRTLQMKKEPNQAAFAQGSLPNPRPDGFYRGTIGFETSWIGKKFFRESSTGINIFKDKQNNQTEKYPFKTYTGKGLFDQNVFVLKIDYNIKGNPFWIKLILDEIVQVAPNEYLGKMHVRIIPGFPFSVLYFELKK